MTPLLDERAYVAEIRSVLNAASTEFDAYDYDDLPGGPQAASDALRKAKLPRMFVLIQLERRSGEQRKAVGRSTQTLWRPAFRAAGSTVDECRGVGFVASRALDGVHLLIGGRTVTPHIESHTAPAWDDGRYVSEYVLTFTH